MTQQKSTQRFSSAQRFEHIVLIVAFAGLALTGMPQKYADKDWAKTLIDLLGGIESTRIIHRAMAILLMAEVIYHALIIGFGLIVLGQRASLIPRRQDFKDARAWILFNLGLKAERPKMPHFNFSEKWDYWFTVIGIVIMAITGFLMWNPIAATKLLPGEVIPSARVIHGGEALLMIIGILTWHLYSTITKRNFSIFTGKISRKRMEEDHAAAIDLQGPTLHPPETIARRRSRYFVGAGLVLVLLVGGLAWFVTFEETALTTVPRREEAFFLPEISLPETGNAEIGAALWPTVRCARCHGESATGGGGNPALRGTTLNFEEFLIQVRQGRGSMPAISADEIPDAYVLHLWTWLTEASETES